MEKATRDFGVTHGLDFARWITEIADVLKRVDATDPSAQVCFLEIAKSLERLRKYKKNLILGVYKNVLVVNEAPITQQPTASIIADPLIRLMDAAGLWSIEVDHRVGIGGVEALCQVLANPEAPRDFELLARKHVRLNPVKYIVVFADAATAESAAALPESEDAASAAAHAGDGSQLFQESEVKEAVDDAFAGWSEEDDPLKAASRGMARTLEEVMPSLEKLASLDKKAPADFLRGYFEKNFAKLTEGKEVEEFLTALGHVLRALSPGIQEHIFGKTFRKVERRETIEALRGTGAEFRTNYLLARMRAGTSGRGLRQSAELLVGPGGEVPMVEHIARRLLAVDIAPDERAHLQQLLNVFGFDPSQAVRRRIVLFIGPEGAESQGISRLLTRRGYGVIVWDGSEGDKPPGQETEPDIAIFDATGSGDAGQVLLRRIAKANKKIPIVVLSDSMADASPFYDLGMGRVSVLQRPVPNDVLLSFFEDARSTSSRGAVPGMTPGQPVKESTSKFMKADLARAREIQERLIPREIPSVSGADLAVAYRPCSEVGGDYLDLYWLAPGKLGFVIADVSGKGVAAAMVMVMVRSVFRTVSAGTQSPRETLLHVNRMLARDVKKGIFVSAMYGVYDVETHRATVSNGGHNPPILWRHGPSSAEYFTLSGMALGLTERASFENSIKEVSVDLAPGDKLFLYTDGVTEAFGPEGLMYGEERLMSVFSKFAKTPARSLVDSVMSDIDHFIGRAPRSDDTTMLIIGRPSGALVDQIAP
ncbi:MAG: SpoIIE family protein phosphatase [Planctomycetes bacterium]|nr:SpoIIE family protein phosphatase [Planctomycetota bacterium]